MTLACLSIFAPTGGHAGDVTSGGGVHSRLDLVLTDRLGPWVGGQASGPGAGLVLDAGLLAIDTRATPVAWLSLSAMAAPDGVRLAWSVTADSDPAGFLIEREIVGTDVFERLTAAPLAGSARQFHDPAPPDVPETAYRLVGIDRAGRSVTSLPIRVTLDRRAMVFSVSPPRPNPSSAGATLALDLPEPGPVRLRVFDIAGRLVAEPFHDLLPAGQHQLPWNGQASQGTTGGGPVASGVYFLRLESGTRHVVHRVVIRR